MAEIGKFGWVELTVPNAENVKAFYEKVVGWTSSGLDMGGYDDYVMKAPKSGDVVAGVCHARGQNAELPPVWLVYFNVSNLEESLAQCKAAGGKVLAAVRVYGDQGRYAVIQDPAGAVAALFEWAQKST